MRRVHKRWDFFCFCLWAKFYFHTQICSSLEAFQISQTLSSSCPNTEKHRKLKHVFILTLSVLIAAQVTEVLNHPKYLIILNKGFRVHPFLVMDGTL